MKKIPKEVFSYVHDIKKIHYYGSYFILETRDSKYLCRDVLPLNIVNYFKSISFDLCYFKMNHEEFFDLCYISRDSFLSISQILIDLYEKSMKKSYYSIEELQSIYQKLVSDYDSSFQYYFHLQDALEEMEYLDYSHYKLLLHASRIYHLLSLGRYFLEEWFQYQFLEYNNVFSLNELNPSCFYMGKIVYVSSFLQNNLLFELANYYRLFSIDDAVSMLSNFSFEECEFYLFYSLIGIPVMIRSFHDDDVSSFLLYIDKTVEYLSEKYEENQKRKQEMFNQQ